MNNSISDIFGIRIISSELVPEGYAVTQNESDFYVSRKDAKDIVDAKDSDTLESTIKRLKLVKLPADRPISFKEFTFKDLSNQKEGYE